jgi:1,4-alpha-glucan branching enzyme
MIIYQLHVGTCAISKSGIASNFLDIIAKIPYLVALGVNVLQPLPVDEVETDPSLGYDGADYFPPDFPYVVTDPGALTTYLATINGRLEAKGPSPLALGDIKSAPAQLKALVDLCHVYGIAVAFDVVYNHAGGFTVDARSRPRFVTGILLTAPGIPKLFMGQEFLKDKQWSWDPKSSDLLWWDGLNTGADAAMVDHLRFTQDLIRLRLESAGVTRGQCESVPRQQPKTGACLSALVGGNQS